MDFNYLTSRRHVKMMVRKGNYSQMAELQAPVVLCTGGGERKIDCRTFQTGDLLEFIGSLKVSFCLSGFLPVKRGVSCIMSLELLDMGWKMILPIWMVEAATCLQTKLYKYHTVGHIPII